MSTVPVPVRHRQTDRQTDASLWQYLTLRSIAREKVIIIMNSNSWYVGLHIMNFALNSKTVFHTHVASICSCSVTADVIGKEARKIAAFMSFIWPHPYSTPILGVFLLHQTAHVGVSESRDPKLLGRAIIYEVFQRVWKSYLNVTDGQTTCNLITALCVASRGNKRFICAYFLKTTTTGLHFQPTI